jgi:hypothetical protein
MMFVILKGRKQCSLVGFLFWKGVNVVVYLIVQNQNYLNCANNNILAKDDFIGLFKLQL